MADPLDDHSAILSAIRSEWNTTEETIKQAEQVCNNIVFPSINELRYAGRRLIDGLDAMTNGKQKKEVLAFFEDARFNCLRARHDAIDSSLSKMAVDVDVMIGKLKYETIIPIYSEFPSFVRLLTSARRVVAESRKDRENRDKIYASLQSTDFPALIRHYQDLMSSEEMMKRHARQGRRMHVVHYGGLVFGILGFLGFIWDHWDWISDKITHLFSAWVDFFG